MHYPLEIEDSIVTIKNSLGNYAESENLGSLEELSPDTAAGMIRAMAACTIDGTIVTNARQKLAGRQLQDGRVALSPQTPHIHWYTALAILAWTQAPGFEKNLQRAISFLLRTSGIHCAVNADSAVSHDTSLNGWPWISGTHSWVEPTATALIALKANGHEKHERTKDAVRMLLDRQLPGGGWNYGNTFVYGTEMRPIPEYTAIALSALHGYVAYEKVKNSLEYLTRELETIRTPLTLSRGICALGIWSQRPKNSDDCIIESIRRQKRCGPYSMTLLSEILIAFLTTDGITIRFCKG